MKVRIKQATKDGWIICDVGGVADFSYPTSKTRRGRVESNGQISPTITTTSGVCKVEGVMRIRSLTPRECWRLMDFSDRDYNMAKYGQEEPGETREISNTQLYKQAGNSIVRSVLMGIFSQLDIQGIPKWNERSDTE